MRFRAVSRGTFRQLALPDGSPVEIKLFGCMVDREPYVRNDKTYVALDLIDAVGDLDVLRAVDEFIEHAARPEFSPYRPPLVIAKMPANVEYATATGEPGSRFDLRRGELVDVLLRPGAFGSFGYCLLVSRVKPHALQTKQTKQTEQ